MLVNFMSLDIRLSAIYVLKIVGLMSDLEAQNGYEEVIGKLLFIKGL